MAEDPPLVAMKAVDIPPRTAVSFYPEPFPDEGRQPLSPGMCVGFRAGTGNAHHLHNETTEDVMYLEVGDRTSGDDVNYPDDDLRLVVLDGKSHYAHKDGTPY